MESKTIALWVNADLALLYEQASPEMQRKVQILFNMLLREMMATDANPLTELMDMISDRAHERGLTPEILDEERKSDDKGQP